MIAASLSACCLHLAFRSARLILPSLSHLVTTTRMPIIIFHGQADILIAPGCSDPTAALQPGFPASATLWAKKNGCKDTYAAVPETMGQCFVYDDCPTGGQVQMCSFPSLGHAWAGAPVCPSCIGSGMGFASATRLQWDFFKKYAW